MTTTTVRVLIFDSNDNVLEDFYVKDPETEYDGPLSSTDMAMLVRATVGNTYEIESI